MNHGISFGLGFVCALLGVMVGGAAAQMVESSSAKKDYDEATTNEWVEHFSPKCPDGSQPTMRGIVTPDGETQWAYWECAQ
jgi:hypothetical protein